MMMSRESINAAGQSCQLTLGWCRIRSPHRSLRCHSARAESPATHLSSATCSGRRNTLLAGVSTIALLVNSHPAQAIGFQKQLKKKVIPEEDYTVSELNGLKYYDVDAGRGEAIVEGKKVLVHFDVMFRGIDVVSSRSSRLLGGNRTIAEPFEFAAGKPVTGVAAKKINDAAGGLFSGQGGPQPPPALSTAVLGMKRGGKRLVIVDSPALGYGDKGVGEMPGGQTFQLKIEVLDIV